MLLPCVSGLIPFNLYTSAIAEACRRIIGVYLHQLFRSFRPLHNPIGFGAADFLLLGVAIAFSAAILGRAVLLRYLPLLSTRTLATMIFLAGSAVMLRIAMLHSAPVPIASGADDFSFLLLADTLRHFRMSNPTHSFHRFFEAVFVLQQPTYSSIYPLGQGLLLAFGKLLFGSYWAGVLISSGILAALCYWTLRAWVTPAWALVGGILAVIQFGPMSQWTNSYWGGAISACAGCLVFGSLPRIEKASADEKGMHAIRGNALLLGLGLGIQLLTRPFEFLLLVVCAALYWALVVRRYSKRLLLCTGTATFVAVAPACVLLALHNKSVTGRWTEPPYLLSRYQYGVPTTFTWQPVPVPHRDLTPEQELDYRAQAEIHGVQTDSVTRYVSRLFSRLRYLRFFLLPPLFLVLPMFLPRLREIRWCWLASALGVFLLGSNFYPYFYPHYVAAISCLILVLATRSLQDLSAVSTWGKRAAQLLLLVCGMHFLFWYGLRTAGGDSLAPATNYQTWDFVNGADPQGRKSVADALAKLRGKQLVFVRYSPSHRFAEWIANAADIDSARVVMARDLGPAENSKLIGHFPGRKAWLLEPDATPPRLSTYPAEGPK